MTHHTTPTHTLHALLFSLMILFSAHSLADANYDEKPTSDEKPTPVIDIVSLISAIITTTNNKASPMESSPLDLFSLSSRYPSPPRNFPPKRGFSTPEIPAINREVIGLKNDTHYTAPHIPPLRFNADGRLAVYSESRGVLDLYLVNPEKINTNFMDSEPGPHILSELKPVELSANTLTDGQYDRFVFSNICDPIIDNKNPYACGDNLDHDCYDVSVILTMHIDTVFNDVIKNILGAEIPSSRISSTPITVKVENPKTPRAKIVDVTHKQPTFSKRTFLGRHFESLTPLDGHLYVARQAHVPLTWHNEATNKDITASYDVVYSMGSDEYEACDAAQWNEMKPISHAPYDTSVNNRYLFAKQPFRDPEGKIIPDGIDIKGTYPWMDKEAKMLSIQTGTSQLFPTGDTSDNAVSRYPVRCVVGDDCKSADVRDTSDINYMIFGAWTQGKMVQLDGLLNEVDFQLGSFNNPVGNKDLFLELYQPNTGVDDSSSHEALVGSSRARSQTKLKYTDGSESDDVFHSTNSSIFDSIENRFNYLTAFKPGDVHDVVWNMSSGRYTREVPFDDYLNPDGFIVSNMVAYSEFKNNSPFFMTYFDGWHNTDKAFSAEVRVQNSATAKTDRWNIPSYGQVSNGRMEPVANGGIKGKGLWFNGNDTKLTYDVSGQPTDIKSTDWYWGVFLDKRNTDSSSERIVAHFPNDSMLSLVGHNELRYYCGGRSVATLTLPQTTDNKRWFHLGFLAEQNGRKITAHYNGFAFDERTLDCELFQFEEGQLSLGVRHTPPVTTLNSLFQLIFGSLMSASSDHNKARPFNGWMDEFKVFAYKPDQESLCNFAKGSLVGLTNQSPAHIIEQAQRYPEAQHQQLTDRLRKTDQTTFEQYACAHDYTDDDLVSMHKLPKETVSLRSAIHFPEGPVYHDAPRPDSSQNAFCLSCHHDEGLGGLSLAALTKNPNLMAKDDPRRQPTQPPAKVRGVIPANWLPSSPATQFNTGENGIDIDEWVLPSAHNN